MCVCACVSSNQVRGRLRAGLCMAYDSAYLGRKATMLVRMKKGGGCHWTVG